MIAAQLVLAALLFFSAPARADAQPPRHAQTRHRESARAVAWDVSGATIASAGLDGRVILWNAAGGKPSAVLGDGSRSFYSLALLPEGRVAAGGTGGVSVWRLSDSRLIADIRSDSDVTGLAWLAEPKLLAGALQNGGVTLWSLEPVPKEADRFDTDREQPVSLSANYSGSLLAVLTQTGTLSLWTTGRGRLLGLAAHPAGGKCVAVSPNAKYALSGGLENSLKIWRISDGAAVRSFDTGDEVSACAWTPAGDFVAAAGPSGRIKIFSIQDGAKTQEFAGRRGEVFSAAFSRDGKLLASAGEDGAVRVWKLQYPSSAPPQAFVSPDAARASTIAVAASTQTVQERRYGEPPPSAESQLRQFIAGHPAAAAGAGAALLALLLFPALAKLIGSRLKTAPSNAQADNPAYTVRTQMKMDDVHNRQEEAKRALAVDRAGSALPESSWLAHYDPKNADKQDSGKNDK